MKMNPSLRLLLNGTLVRAFALAAVACMGTQQARAASDSWNVNGNGTWVATTNWLGNSTVGSNSTTTSTDIATFGFSQTANNIVTVDANRNIGGITFSSNALLFGQTLSGGSLKLSSGGVIQSLTSNGTHTDSIATAIEIQGNGGNATLLSNGTSAGNRIIFGNAAGADITGVSTSGNTTTLNLDGSNAGANYVARLGDGFAGGNLAVVKNGTGMWRIDGGALTTAYSGGLTLNAGTLGFRAYSFGNGTLTLNGGKLLVANFASPDLTFNNAIVVGGDFTVQKSDNNAYTETFSGNMDLGNATRTITATKSATGSVASGFIFSGVISNGGLTKAGTDALTLSGNNIYTGTTTVSSGTLLINGDSSAATGAVAVTSATSVLGGSGTIGGATTISANATLTPGASAGASSGLLAFSSSLTFSDINSKANFEVATGARGTNYDAVDVGGLLTYNGDLTLTMAAAIADGTYNLFGFGSQAGSFDTIVFGAGAYSGNFTNGGSGVWTAASGGQTFTFTQATGTLGVVPEPATSVLLALSLTAVMVLRRRRA